MLVLVAVATVVKSNFMALAIEVTAECLLLVIMTLMSDELSDVYFTQIK